MALAYPQELIVLQLAIDEAADLYDALSEFAEDHPTDGVFRVLSGIADSFGR